jgi:hypothetical protein
VFLRVDADKERGNIDHLLANTDVALSDQNTSMVDGLGKTLLKDLGLESSLHESLSGQLKDIIEGVLLVSQKTISLQAAEKRRSLEESLGVFWVQSEESTSRLRSGGEVGMKRESSKRNDAYLTNFGEKELDTPDLSLATKSIFTA